MHQLLQKVKDGLRRLVKFISFQKSKPDGTLNGKPTEESSKRTDPHVDTNTKESTAWDKNTKAISSFPTEPQTNQEKHIFTPLKMTSSTLQIVLKNQSNSSQVYGYVTGQAIDHNFSPVLIQADGHSLYYPSNPSKIGSPLALNCAISLGSPGSSRTITIPRLAGGRIWFSIDAPLTFLLNPGGGGVPGLVEPSVTNQSDPNYNINWAFCEFTYNQSQMYANISFVDFVSLPISISLTNSSGSTQTVTGLPSGGMGNIANQLTQQSSTDGCQGWKNLQVRNSKGQLLRILSPNNGILLRPNDFGNYFDPYVTSVLSKYSSNQAITTTINGQTYSGRTTSNSLTIGSETFARPNTADIFSSNTGPFTTGADSLRNALIPQIAAAFNRSTLLVSNSMPAPLSAFYQNAITNHYSRIVHAIVSQGKGYAFPYDDVPPASGGDQSGYVNDGNPLSMTVTVGAL